MKSELDPLKTFLYSVIDEQIEMLQPKKKIGDLICGKVICLFCPLLAIGCERKYNKTLYENLEETSVARKDEELYNILKAKLDQEIE